MMPFWQFYWVPRDRSTEVREPTHNHGKTHDQANPRFDGQARTPYFLTNTLHASGSVWAEAIQSASRSGQDSYEDLLARGLQEAVGGFGNVVEKQASE